MKRTRWEEYNLGREKRRKEVKNMRIKSKLEKRRDERERNEGGMTEKNIKIEGKVEEV